MKEQGSPADWFNLGSFDERAAASKRSMIGRSFEKTESMRIRLKNFWDESAYWNGTDKACFWSTVVVIAVMAVTPVAGVYFANTDSREVEPNGNVLRCKNFVDIPLVELDVGRSSLIERFAARGTLVDVLTYGPNGYQNAVDLASQLNEYYQSDVRVVEPMSQHQRREGAYYLSERGDCRLTLFSP